MMLRSRASFKGARRAEGPTAPVAGMALWLDASDASTLYDATTGGSLVAADGTIARWEDRSGNGYHVTQSTSGARPIRKTAIQNALDVVRFDGSDDTLWRGLEPICRDVPGITAFSIHRWASSPTSSRVIAGLITSTGVNRLAHYGGNSSGKWTSGGRRRDFNSLQVVNSAASIGTTDSSLLTSRLDYQGTDLNQWIDGTLDGASTSFQSAGNSSDTDVRIGIGANRSGEGSSLFFHGDISEVVIYPWALSTADRESVQSYLATKWGT